MLAHVIVKLNPFAPLSEKEVFAVTESLTVREWLERQYKGFVEFDLPTVCYLNGKPLLRRFWDSVRIVAKDVVSFITLQGDPFTIIAIIAIVIAVASIALAVLIDPPKLGDVSQPDSVFNLRGQRNQNRLSYPIEVPYGRNRLWPSLAATPYTKYDNNEQILYQLLSLGQGEFSIEAVQIEDTAIGSFQDITYEIYGPGQQVTLFPDNVETSSEVADVELFGTNEAENEGPVGGFAVNPSLTQTNLIEVDLVLSVGLYLYDSNNNITPLQVTALFEYREIDDLGNALGSWTTLFTFDKTLSTNTPQRFTVSTDVVLGRYEIRGERTNDKNLSASAGNTLVWSSVRAFLPSTKDYGNVSLIAIRARSSNNLNDSAANRVNIIATRKLPIYDGSAWSAATATRSIVWAFCDVFRSTYGGKLADIYLDLAALVDFDTLFTSHGDTFDFVFDNKSTLWETAKIIARVGRAVPMLNGSQITMVRDDLRSVSVGVFGPENILAGTFKHDVKLAALGDNDCVEITYVDPVSFKPETVLCLTTDDTATEPKQITLQGCTNRDRAYREGMYIRSKDLLREQISFATGYEGNIPTYGDLITVSHDVPRWGVSGYITELSTPSATSVTLDRAVTFTEDATNVILIRKKDGSSAGPFEVIPTSDPLTLDFVSPISLALYFDDVHEKPIFLFGTSELCGQECLVVGLTPSDEESVQIKCIPYTPSVFQYDALDAPPISSAPVPPVIPDLPIVANVQVTPLNDAFESVIITWNPALGARLYTIQLSQDNINWTTLDTVSRTNLTRVVPPGLIYIRVAGINVGAGPWATYSGTPGVTLSTPKNVIGLKLESSFVGTSFTVIWDAVAGADGYVVRILLNQGTIEVHTETVVTETFTYDISDAIADGSVSRSMRVSVIHTISGVETGDISALDIYNPIPPKLTGYGASVFDDQPTYITYRIEWITTMETDFAGYVVYGSTDPAFIPGPGNLLATVTPDSTVHYDWTIPKVHGGHNARYWKIGCIDVWGDESTYTSRHTLAAIATNGDFNADFNVDFF